MRALKWILLGLLLAALAGLWYFNRIQWGGGPPSGPMPVLAAPLESATYQPTFKQTGRLSSVAEAQLRTAVNGTVEKVHFTEGQLVAAGQVLFTLDIRAFGAQSRQAVAQAVQAKAAYERGQQLRAEDAISQADLEARRAAYQAAAAASTEAGVVGSRAEIKAPLAGRVGRAEVNIGEVVQQGTTLLTTVQQLSPLYVDFELDEQTYLALAQSGEGQLKGTKVAVGLASDTDFPLEATLTGLDNQLGTQSGSLRVRATLANPAGTLIPGLFARVKVDLPTQATALLVNDAAIGTDQGTRFLYKVVAGAQPVRVGVQVGDLVNGLRAVQGAGLQAGDLVVVNGLMRIRPGSEVTPMPADMRTLLPISGTVPTAAAVSEASPTATAE
jgi:multidrug efflux system membrane fusion protein